MSATIQTPKQIANAIRKYMKSGDDSFKHVTCSQSDNRIVIDGLNNLYAIDVAKMACPGVKFEHVSASTVMIAEIQTDAHAGDYDGCELRAQFKESYYVMGDKITVIQQMTQDMAKNIAQQELAILAQELENVHAKLRHWADVRLPKWD